MDGRTLAAHELVLADRFRGHQPWLGLFVYATSLDDICLVQPLMSAGDLLLVIMAVALLKVCLGAIEWTEVLLTLLRPVALGWEAVDTHISKFGAVRLSWLLVLLVVAGGALPLADRRPPSPSSAWHRLSA